MPLHRSSPCTLSSYHILALLRIHKFDENVSTAVHELYPIAHATTLMTDNRADASEQPTSPNGEGQAAPGEDHEEQKGPGDLSISNSTARDVVHWVRDKVDEAEQALAVDAAAASGGGGGGKKQKKKKTTLKQTLMLRGSGIAQYVLTLNLCCSPASCVAAGNPGLAQKLFIIASWTVAWIRT